MSQFTLNGVRKYYGERVVLDLEQLTIERHQFHIITGPNGSGKSTLLNILALLMRPDSGEVIFGREPVNWSPDALRALRTRVTLLHQSPFLFAGSVEYNLAYGLRLRGYDRSTIQSRTADALATVGLSGFQTRSVKHLSGGERRRVALARALALQPEVLLLDEPLANVDRGTARELERLISELPRSGTTVIMATHHLHHDDPLAENVIALEEGKLDLANCRFTAH